MIEQLTSQLIPALIAGAIAYFTYYLSRLLENGEARSYGDLCRLLVKTPALNSFLLFVSRTLIAATLLCSAFGRIASHIVISLDILYFASILMLVLFHNLKVLSNPLLKEI